MVRDLLSVFVVVPVCASIQEEAVGDDVIQLGVSLFRLVVVGGVCLVEVLRQPTVQLGCEWLHRVELFVEIASYDDVRIRLDAVNVVDEVLEESLLLLRLIRLPD